MVVVETFSHPLEMDNSQKMWGVVDVWWWLGLVYDLWRMNVV